MLRRLLLTTWLVLVWPLPVFAQDAADIVVRLNRVENVTRQLSGQIEQLQYENRQLKEQLRKFQEDVEFRFQEGRGSAGAPPARAPAAPPAATRKPLPAPAESVPYGVNPGAAKPERRGDAFDPAQHPNAPGAPRRLGETTPSLLVPVPPGAKLEMQVVGTVPPNDESLADDTALSQPGLGEAVDLIPPQANVPTTGTIAAPTGASVAATGSGDARADFDAAYALIQGRHYEAAEMSLRQFIQSHPRDRLVPRATYWLGESYLQRNRSREAAEQFLKVSTEHVGSVVAPDAMLKLGVSLSALGAKAQACATLAEVERKFPSASTTVRQGVEREMRRARCAA